MLEKVKRKIVETFMCKNDRRLYTNMLFANSSKKGITLIALVITIIILLILAGIVINLTIGQKGILTRAEEAGRNYQKAAKEEDEILKDLLNYDGIGGTDEVTGIEIYGKMYTNADGKEVLVLSSKSDYQETSSGLTLKEDYGNVGNKRYHMELKEYTQQSENGETISVTEMSGVIAPWLHRIEFGDTTTKFIAYENENLVEVKIIDEISPVSTSGWFFMCPMLTSLDLSNLNTSHVTDMSFMFTYCFSLTSLDISHFNTSNVTNMLEMFSNCNKLANLDLSSFDTSQVTNMAAMFDTCSELTNLDVSNFNTSNVTNMSYMFHHCGKLTNLDLSNFNTSNVTDMSYMFAMDRDTHRLTNLDISSFDTSNVINMSYMFYQCAALTNLDLSNFNTSNVTDMHYMFTWCLSLTNLDLSSFDTSNVTDMSYMFVYCNHLTSILVSNKWKQAENASGMFDNCSVDKVTLKQ